MGFGGFLAVDVAEDGVVGVAWVCMGWLAGGYAPAQALDADVTVLAVLGNPMTLAFPSSSSLSIPLTFGLWIPLAFSLLRGCWGSPLHRRLACPRWRFFVIDITTGVSSWQAGAGGARRQSVLR